MFGSLLGISEKVCFVFSIFKGIPPPRSCSGNRPENRADPSLVRLRLHHHLGAGTDQLPLSEVEERHVGGWIDHPQTAIQIQRRMVDISAQPLAHHKLKGIAGSDMVPSLIHRPVEILPGAIAAGVWRRSSVGPPVEGTHGRKGRSHAFAQGVDAGHRALPGCLRAFSSSALTAEIAIGHCSDQSFHLVEDQDAVHQHPQSIRGTIGNRRVHWNARLDPADQLIAPHPIELAQRRKSRQGGWFVRLQAAFQAVERVAAESLAVIVSPGALQSIAPRRESPHGVAGDDTPSPKCFTTFYRLEQHTGGALIPDLEPGGEWRFQIRRPAAGHRNQGCT
ncbi:MAG: Uncharacterised protein [Cyanobium sp. ARS6]|nr:MAG: Uncharacterised protein [Cyanobium sp. ARS6]